MASSAGDSFAHLQSIDEVRFEIQVQNTILLSLQDGPQDDDTLIQIREAKQSLKTLRQILKTHEQATGIANRPLSPHILQSN